MRWKKTAGIATSLIGTVLILSGCGTYASTSTSSWMKIDAAKKTVILKVDEGYNSTNNYLNFNGYAHGQMTVTVPLGYKVTVMVTNDSGIPAEFGVYNANNQLVFKGSGDSIAEILGNPSGGILPGESETLHFVASKSGDFKMANLIDRIAGKGQQANGMWDNFQVVSGGAPGVSVS